MRSILALVFALFALPALAALPVPSNGIISAPGEYYLTADRTSIGTTNIQITANGVTLDLKRKTIRCNPANPRTAVTFGIKIDGGNVTVQNGAVTGCFMGIHAGGSPGNTTFMRIDFTGNTYIGVHGGTTFIGNTFDSISGYDAEPYAIGINSPAYGCRVFGNTFRNLHRQPVSDPAKIGEGVGVLLSAGSTACLVDNNWFENDTLGPERDIGVWVAVGASAVVTGNSFTNFGRAVANRGIVNITNNRFWMRADEVGSVAVDAEHAEVTTTPANNLIIGFQGPWFGNVTDGGNTILP